MILIGLKFIIWLRGQEVKTSPFHGGDMGSIPVGVTKYATLAQLVEQLTCGIDKT